MRHRRRSRAASNLRATPKQTTPRRRPQTFRKALYRPTIWTRISTTSAKIFWERKSNGHMIRRSIILLSVILGIAAFMAGVSSAQKAIPRDLRITLERSTCFGTCPDYKLTVTGDGTVVFEGREFVKVKG